MSLHTLSFSPLRVSTLTVIASVTEKENRKPKILDLDKIAEAINLTDQILGIKSNKIEKGIPTSKKRAQLRERGKKDTVKLFGNSSNYVITTSNDPEDTESRIYVKLSSNGRLQMANCKSKEDTLKAIKILTDSIISDVKQENLGILKEHIKPIFDHIDMINSDFTMGDIEIDVYNVRNILAKKYNMKSILEQNSQHHACLTIKRYNLKDDLGITENERNEGSYSSDRCVIEIFQTGKLILTGARTFACIYKTYEAMKAIMKEEIKNIILLNDQ